jgi:hypothetical protein
MADLFISYSRRDGDFVRRLHQYMVADGRDVWVDFEDIPLSADWWSEIARNIESADTFIFVISPDSLGSPVCQLEVAHATALNKRLIPIVRVMTDERTMLEALAKRPLDDNMRATLAGRDMATVARQNWQAISRHNWIFFSDDTAFDTTLRQLITVIDTDLEHVRRHTRLLVRAREWETRAKSGAYLLNSGEIREYSAWIRQSEGKEPRPLELQLEYLFVSQRAANRRQAALLVGTMIGLVVTGVLIALAYLQNERIVEGEQTRVAIERLSLAQQATAQAQALILTEQRATSESSLLLVTAQVATGIARQTAAAQDQAERLTTAQAGFLSLTQQAEAQLTATAFIATLEAANAASTQAVGTVRAFQNIFDLVGVQPPPNATNAYNAFATQVALNQSLQALRGTESAQNTQVAASQTAVGGTGNDATLQSYIELLTQTAQVPLPPAATASPSPSPTFTLTPSPSPFPTLSPALENTLFVDATNGSDVNACNQPELPCASIGAALAKAASGSTINVGYGIYTENIRVDKDIRLVGAARDLTILDGGGETSTISVDSGARLDIAEITITGGQGLDVGGGIDNRGTLITRNVIITGNSALGNGGGIANFGSASLMQTTISNNIGANGGGLWNAYGARFVTDTQTTITSNTALRSPANNETYASTCQTDVTADDLASALAGCARLNGVQACLVSPVVEVVNGDGSPFAAPGDVIALNTVTELRFSTLGSPSRGIALLNTSPVEGPAQPQNLLYVRGAELPNWVEQPPAPGGQALAVPGFDSPLNVRTAPALDGDIVTAVVHGTVLAILDGPISADGYDWWQVRLPNTATGWAVGAAEDGPTLRSVQYGSVGIGGRYTVYGAGARGLNLRAAPTIAGQPLTTLIQGRDVTIMDGPVQADGFTWWYVVTTYSNEAGWVAGEVDGVETLIPVITESYGVPQAFQFSDEVCTAITQNPLRLETPGGTLRIALTTLGD